MSTPFLGEIRAFGFHFAPYGWAFCNGQPMSIAQNSALYTVIGTIYGGDGQSTFNLPNLQDRAAMHWGNGAGLTPRVIGEVLGSETDTLTLTEMPSHSHALQGRAAGTATQTQPAPSADAWFGSSGPAGKAYNATAVPAVQFSGRALSPNGGSAPHTNMQPLLTLNFCIALEGIFPPHS